MTKYYLEACCQSAQDALTAQTHGASRIELCDMEIVVIRKFAVLNQRVLVGVVVHCENHVVAACGRRTKRSAMLVERTIPPRIV